MSAGSCGWREVEFIRADWASYLNLDRLPERSGCSGDQLRRIILKKVAGNGLHAGANVVPNSIDDDTWSVADDGPWLDRAQVLRFYALNPP